MEDFGQEVGPLVPLFHPRLCGRFDALVKVPHLDKIPVTGGHTLKVFPCLPEPLYLN